MLAVVLMAGVGVSLPEIPSGPQFEHLQVKERGAMRKKRFSEARSRIREHEENLRIGGLSGGYSSPMQTRL
jgi:hypothetical protein